MSSRRADGIFLRLVVAGLTGKTIRCCFDPGTSRIARFDENGPAISLSLWRDWL